MDSGFCITCCSIGDSAIAGVVQTGIIYDEMLSRTLILRSLNSILENSETKYFRSDAPLFGFDLVP